jgi:hypothetical protein
LARRKQDDTSIIRKKYTTLIDEEVLAKLAAKSKIGCYGTPNRVIEALANNFIEYLDNNGGIRSDIEIVIKK